MIFYALAALAAGALAGIFLALRHFTRKRMPVWAALLHGLGGATGFLLVLLIVVREPAFHLARQALYLLIATVALGVVNLLFHVRKVRHRTSLILMHAGCAVSGVSTLIYAAVAPASEPATAALLAPALTAPTPAAPAEPAASSNQPAPSAVAAIPGASPASRPETAPPSRAPAAAVAAQETGSALGPLSTGAIHFESASAVLSTNSLSALEQVASLLSVHPEIKLVEVQGHADERGEDGRNVALTRARAQALVDALAAKGIARDRLHAAGYGARCPADPACSEPSAAASCHDPSRYSDDRRAVFLVLRAGSQAFKGEMVCPQGATLIPPADRSFYQARH